MLWQGQEFADSYNLPGSGQARVGLRRDVHWEYFYDDYGAPLVRLYRRLGQLRGAHRALRSRDSYFYYLQSLQGNSIVAYHRHAAASDGQLEEFVMVLLNFAANAGTINVPFPKAGVWQEMLDADKRAFSVAVPSDGAVVPVTVNSNYGMVLVLR